MPIAPSIDTGIPVTATRPPSVETVAVSGSATSATPGAGQRGAGAWNGAPVGSVALSPGTSEMPATGASRWIAGDWYARAPSESSLPAESSCAAHAASAMTRHGVKVAFIRYPPRRPCLER
jgi:hypothetical protein